MTEHTPIGGQLAVSRWVDRTTGDTGLVLWERKRRSTEWRPLGKMGRTSGHTIDMETLTVTPSIVAGSRHGYLENGRWRDVPGPPVWCQA